MSGDFSWVVCPVCGENGEGGKVEITYYARLGSAECACECGMEWEQLETTVREVLNER